MNVVIRLLPVAAYLSFLLLLPCACTRGWGNYFPSARIMILAWGVTDYTDQSIVALSRIFGPVGDFLPSLGQVGILQELMGLFSGRIYHGWFDYQCSHNQGRYTASQGVALGNSWSQIKA